MKCKLLMTIQSTWQKEIQYLGVKQSRVVTIKIILLKAEGRKKLSSYINIILSH